MCVCLCVTSALQYVCYLVLCFQWVSDVSTDEASVTIATVSFTDACLRCLLFIIAIFLSLFSHIDLTCCWLQSIEFVDAHYIDTCMIRSVNVISCLFLVFSCMHYVIFVLRLMSQSGMKMQRW